MTKYRAEVGSASGSMDATTGAFSEHDQEGFGGLGVKVLARYLLCMGRQYGGYH